VARAVLVQRHQRYAIPKQQQAALAGLIVPLPDPVVVVLVLHLVMVEMAVMPLVALMPPLAEVVGAEMAVVQPLVQLSVVAVVVVYLTEETHLTKMALAAAAL
jgi:hypothetical protein